jgi:tape measure domain-containing protein
VANVGYATISIIPDLKGFQSKLNTGVEEASVSAGREGGSGLGSSLLGTLGGLGIGLAVSKSLDIGKAVLDFDSGIQQSTTALTTLLHSAPAANALVTQLENLAQASSLLDTGQAVHLGQVLLGMGVPTKDVTTDMQALADATAGVGGTPDTLNSLSLAWGQMAAKGKIQSDEILQMTEQGVPALQLLAKAYGVPTATMQAMISKGQVLSSDALPKLRAEIEKNFGGADAAAGAQSIGGAFDRIKEAALGLAGSAAMPLIKGLTPIIAKMADAMGSPKVQAFVDSIGPKLSGLFSGLGGAGGVLSGAMDKLGPTFDLLIQSGESLFQTLEPIYSQIFSVWEKDIGPNLIPTLQKLMLVISDAMSTLSVVIDALWSLFGPTLLAAIDTTYKTIVAIVNEAFDIIEGLFKIIQGLFTGDWSLLWEGVEQVFGAVWDAIKTVLSAAVAFIGEALSAAWIAIKAIFAGVANWFETEVFGAVERLAKLYFDMTKDEIIGAWTAAKAVWGAVAGFFSGLWGDIEGGVTHAFDTVKGAITGAISSAKTTVSNDVKDIVGFFTALPGEIGDLGSEIGNEMVAGVKAIWNDTIGGMGFTMPSWVPVIGGKGFHIPMLAEGGILSAATLAVVGEAGPEAVVPLSKLDDIVARAMTRAGGGGQKVLNYYAAPNSSLDSEEDLFSAASRARMVW